MKTKSNSVKAHTVQIANPIYDYAFKYLMEDNEVARKFVSTIIGEEVIELSFSPQEYVNREDEIPNKLWAYSRLDFTARIRTNEGLKAVMIEVQKVSLGTDILRFRHYLGLQYQEQKERIITKDKDKELYRAIPIYCIFVMGEGIGIDGVPLVKVNMQVDPVQNYGMLKEETKDFLTNLFHRTWIVQVPELKNRRNDKVEVLLSIFDQTNRIANDHRLLNIQEENYPEEYRPIIRRLERAAGNKTIRKAMLEEDFVIGHIQMKEIEQNAIIAEKDSIIAEKEAALAKERAEKEAALAEIEVLKKQLNKNGK